MTCFSMRSLISVFRFHFFDMFLFLLTNNVFPNDLPLSGIFQVSWNVMCVYIFVSPQDFIFQILAMFSHMFNLCLDIPSIIEFRVHVLLQDSFRVRVMYEHRRVRKVYYEVPLFDALMSLCMIYRSKGMLSKSTILIDMYGCTWLKLVFRGIASSPFMASDRTGRPITTLGRQGTKIEREKSTSSSALQEWYRKARKVPCKKEDWKLDSRLRKVS